MDYLDKIEELIKKNNFVFLWNKQNIDIHKLYFSNNIKDNLINYSKDDILLTNLTKLITYFGAGRELNKFDEKYDYNNLKFNHIGIIKTTVYFIKKIYYYFVHKDYTKASKKLSNFQFSNQEINLIAKIKRFSKTKDKDNIIIINNINYANKIDIIFFKKLIDTDFISKYAPNLKFVFICSQSSLLNIKLEEIKKSNFLEISLSEKELCCSIKNTYNDLLISDEKLIQYLRLCNNDLNLIVGIINSNDEKAIGNSLDENIIHLKNIVFEILESNPELTVLEIAAVIGLSFDITILETISSIEIDDIVNRLNEAYNLGLLTKGNNKYNYEFINVFIREIIYKHGNKQSFWHKKFAEEINFLSPNEHALISYHYQLGNESKYAMYHYWAYLLSSAIDQKIQTSFDGLLFETENNIKDNIVLNSNFNYIQNLLNDYSLKKLEKNSLIGGLKKRIGLNNDIDQMIKFTKLSLLYVGKYTNAETEFVYLGEELEKSYKFLKENNIFGLQIRCGLYLIDIYSYRLNETNKAKKIQFELENITNDFLYSLNTTSIFFDNKSLAIKIIRKTSMLTNTEIAYEKTKNILDVCKEYRDSLDEIELYKFFSDHIGYALYSGNYSEVNKDVVDYSVELLETGKNFIFPKQYKLRMNLFLLDLFNNRMSLYDVNKYFKDENKNKSITSSMYKYDMASIALYCNKYSYAEKILLNLYSELKYNNTCFYNYCYNSNLASLYILKKDFEKAKYYNDKILKTSFDWYEDFIRIMKFRAKKFSEFIENRKDFSPKQLYNCFSDIELVVCNSWKFLGKGILFSELMFYRE